MQDRQRYHIIIDKLENVPVVREQLEQSSLTDLRAWVNFPLLLSASLTPAQAEWIRKHPMVQGVETNSSVYLHDDASHQYELKTASPVDALALRNEIIKATDHAVQSYPELPNSLFVTLDPTQLKEFVVLAAAWPQILGMSVNESPIREYSRVLNLQRYNWGVERVSHRTTNLYETVAFTRIGQGVKIYVVDSGILPTHDELKGRVVLGYDAFRETSDPDYGKPSLRVKAEDGTLVFDDHGTHVASIAAGSTVGIAPGATVVSVRAFSEFENSTSEVLLGAVDWIITDFQNGSGPAVVNMSLSILDSNQAAFTIADTISAALIAAGLSLIVSAGNSAEDAFFTSPANAGVQRKLVEQSGKFFLNTVVDDTKKPIVVGASVCPRLTKDGNDSVWTKSNWGDVIDIFAPGVEIYAASLDANGSGVNPLGNGSYAVKSGTSCSAPMVAGIAALHLEENPSLTHSQVRTTLIEQATKNPFAQTEIQHDRTDPPRYLDNGISISVAGLENKVVYSPNRLAFAWHTLTHIEWDEQSYSYDVNENDRLTFSLSAKSTDRYRDIENVMFHVEPVDVPAEYSSSANFLINYNTIDYVESIGNIQILKDFTNFRVNAPAVTSDITGRYAVLASDGRIQSVRGVSINTKNIPTPPKWVSPASGNLLSDSVHKGDRFDNVIAAGTTNVIFRAVQDDGLPVTYTITPTFRALPTGLKMTSDPTTGTAYLQGTVTRIPFSSVPVVYEFLVRATSIAPNGTPMIAERLFSLSCVYDDEAQYFNPIWLGSLYEIEPDIYFLGPASLGNSYFKQVDVINPDLDVLTYKIDVINGYPTGPNTFNGVLPTGLGINSNGEISGIIDPSAGLGNYYFTITVTDEGGHVDAANFVIRLEEGDEDVIGDSDQIIWVTPEGNIGTLWETFPSHVGVEAINPQGSPVTYSLSPNGGSLPEGLEVAPQSGYITGLAPLVEIDTEYEFMIRARVGSRFVDRQFTIIVKTQYKNSSVLIFRSNLMGKDRLDIADWTFTDKYVSKDLLFRPSDSYFGATQEPNMYVLSGTLLAEPSAIMAYLRDYHHRMFLQFGELAWAPAYDPTGAYIYDVVYMRVIDPMAKAGGFKRTLIDGSSPPAYQNVEETLTKYQTNPYDPTLWDEQTKLSRYYPANLQNVREDLVNTLPGHLGLGLDSAEGLPMWMRTKVDQTKSAIKGFTPAVIVAYAKPGNGQTVANTLTIKGFNKAFTGREFILDRYFIANLVTREATRFDVINDVGTTTFDDPTRLDPADQYGFTPEELLNLPDQPQATRFDMKTFETGKYYKFEDDAPILADRYANPDKFKPYE